MSFAFDQWSEEVRTRVDGSRPARVRHTGQAFDAPVQHLGGVVWRRAASARSPARWCTVAPHTDRDRRTVASCGRRSEARAKGNPEVSMSWQEFEPGERGPDRNNGGRGDLVGRPLLGVNRTQVVGVVGPRARIPPAPSPSSAEDLKRRRRSGTRGQGGPHQLFNPLLRRRRRLPRLGDRPAAGIPLQ